MSCSAEHRHWMLRFTALGALLLWASSCSLSESPGSVLENADINSDSESNGVDTENTPNVPDSSPVQDVVNETLAEDTLIQEDAPESGDAEMPGPWIRLLEPKPLKRFEFSSVFDILRTPTGFHALRVRADVSDGIEALWVHVQGPAVLGNAFVAGVQMPIGQERQLDFTFLVEQGMGYISLGFAEEPPPLDWYAWSDSDDVSIPVTRPFYVRRVDCIANEDCDDEMEATSDHCTPMSTCEHALLESSEPGCYDSGAAMHRKQDAFAEYATLSGGCLWTAPAGKYPESAVYNGIESGCVDLVACMWTFFDENHAFQNWGPVVVRCTECENSFSGSPCCTSNFKDN